MSDSLIPFQPAIEEPSNILPISKNSSSILTGRHGYVLFFALGVSESHINPLDVMFLDQVESLGHLLSPPEDINCADDRRECASAALK